jgi:hypothetical protein
VERDAVGGLPPVVRLSVLRRAGIEYYLAKPKIPPKVRSYPARLPRVEDYPLPVHDGDTMFAEVDTGRGTMALLKCRFYNTFAPELGQTGGPECRQFVVDWLTYNAGTRWPYWVDTVLDGNGREIYTFDRIVTTVRSATGAVLNTDMSAYIDAHGYPRGTGG